MLKHRLSLRRGCTVEELEAVLTAEEFLRWRAFNLIEPVGDNRLDILFSILCSVIANANGNKTDNEDFLVRWGEQAIKNIPSSPEEAAAEIRGMMDGLRRTATNTGPILVPQRQATSQI